MTQIKDQVERFTTAISHAAHSASEFVIMAKDAQTPVEKSAAVTTQAGAVLAVVGGLSLNEWAAVVGIVIGMLSFAVNVYVSFRRLRIEEAAASRKRR